MVYLLEFNSDIQGLNLLSQLIRMIVDQSQSQILN